MVQYCSGGKWGLLLRRPLEAMSRTLPLVFVYWLVVAIFMKRLFLWAQYTIERHCRLRSSRASSPRSRPHCLDFKRPMLNPDMFYLVGLLCFAIWGFYYLAPQHAGAQREQGLAEQHALLDQEVREHQRPRHPGLLAHHDRGGHLLGHVDGPHLVLLGLRPAVPRRSGLLGAGALHHRFHLALQGRALQDDPPPDRAARSGQVHLRLRHAQHLPGLLAVPHHLVGQSA